MTRSPGSAASKPATSGWLASGVSAGAIFALSLAVWMAVWVLAPMAIGWRPHVVTSGSMEPNLRVGDVLLGAPVDPGGLSGGEVVTYRDPLRTDRLVTHRVVERTDDGMLITRGDANAAADPAPVDPELVRGAGRVVVPLFGLPFVWATTGAYLPLGALTVVVGALLAGAIGFGRPETAVGRRAARSHRRTAVLAGFATVGVAGAAGMALSLRDPQALLATGILEMATVGAIAVPLIRERLSRGPRPARSPRPGVRRAGTATTVATAGAALVFAAASLAGGLAPTAGAFTVTTENVSNSWGAATLQAPTDLAGESSCGLLSGGRVDLTWTAAAHATSYRVLRSSTSGGPYSEIGTTTNTSYRDDTSLSLGATYHYVVQSVNGSWSSGNSAQVSVKTPTLCL